MSAIIIPENQNLYPTPNEHINFEFGESIEEYRTARYLNNILKMFGPDTFLWGLDLINVTWLSDDEIIFRYNNGVLIQDSTLVKILYTFDLLLTGLTTYTKNNYYVLIYTEFKFEHVTEQVTSNPQQFAIKIRVYDPITHQVYSNNPDNILDIGGLSFIDSVNPGFYLDQLIDNPIEKIIYNDFQLTKKSDIYNLDENEWGIGDQDGIGEDRIYIRLFEDIDPSTLSSNELQYISNKQNLISWDIERNRLILHCAPFTSPYDAQYRINIEDNMYTSRGTIDQTTNFKYDTIEAFNLDGGVL